MRTLVLRKHLIAFFAKHDAAGKFQHSLSSVDYNELRANYAVIGPAKGLTEFVQSSSRPTISLAFPRVGALKRHAENVRRQPSLEDPARAEGVCHNDLPHSAKETGRILASELGKRFAVETLTVEQAIAMALDPRTKAHVAALSDDMQKKIYVQLSSEVQHLRRVLGATAAAPAAAAAAAAADIEEEVDVLNDLMMPAASSSAQPLQLAVTVNVGDAPMWQKALDSEVLHYMNKVDVTIPPKDFIDFNPLKWWKDKRDDNSSPFSLLPVLAAMYLSLACTAARNERTFSYAGRLLDALRSRLDSALVGDMLFIQRNIHLLYCATTKKFSFSKADGTEGSGSAATKAIDIERILEAYIEKHGKRREQKASKRPATDAGTSSAAAAVALEAATESEEEEEEATLEAIRLAVAPTDVDVAAEGMEDDDYEVETRMDESAQTLEKFEEFARGIWSDEV